MVGEKELAGLAEEFGKTGAAGKTAAAGADLFSTSLRGLFKTVSFGVVGGHLAQFLNQLGFAGKNLKQLGPLVFESTQQLQNFTRGLGYAVGGMSAFLDEVDKIERKQSELNRAYGIGAISINNYYKQLVEATGMGGKAARKSAEELILTMREQREGTEKEINQILPLFIKYSLGINASFPRDFVYMHEQLGMNIDEIGDSYETMAVNAAANRIPFELYKNAIFSLTSELHQYGLSTRGAMGVTNLFVDDLKRGTLTINEAQSAMRTLTQMQFTAGGFGERVRMAMGLRRAMAAGEMPEGMRGALEGVTRAQYGPEAHFMELSALQMQHVVHRLDPSMFMRAFKVGAEELMKNIPKEVKPEIFPQFWGGMEYQFFEKRLSGALEGGSKIFVSSVKEAMEGTKPVAREVTKAINDLRKQMEQNTKDMREWYYPLSQFMDWLRSKGLGELGGVAGAAAGAAPGAIMTALAMRGIGIGGAVGAGAAGGAAGSVAAGFAGMLGPMAAFTACLITAGLVFTATNKAFDYFNEKQKQKQMLLEIAESPGSRGHVISLLTLAEEAYRTGQKGIAKEALGEAQKYKGWKELPLPTALEAMIGTEYAAYKSEMEKRKQKAAPLEAFRFGALAGLGAGAPVLILKVDKGVIVEEVENALGKLRSPTGIQIITGPKPGL